MEGPHGGVAGVLVAFGAVDQLVHARAGLLQLIADIQGTVQAQLASPQHVLLVALWKKVRSVVIIGKFQRRFS